MESQHDLALADRGEEAGYNAGGALVESLSAR
jgi:hypothetical protein